MMRLLLSRSKQKIMTSQDNDFWEKDQQIEERQPSYLSELRTSDGAKRQQHRSCGPALALTFNFVVAVSIILMNKMLLGRVGFNYPIALTLIHYTVSYIFMSGLRALSLLPTAPSPNRTPFFSLVALGAVMAVSTGLANVSLKYNSVGFYQMAKISVTPTIAIAEFFLCGKCLSMQKALALTVASVGVAVATVTDLQFNFFGAMVALAWIIPSAANKILWCNLQQQHNWRALALMWKSTPFTLMFLVAIMPWLDPPNILHFNWTVMNTTAILLSAVLGFLLQLSGGLALGATSPITHVVLGQFKTCVIVIAGSILFQSNPGFQSLVGVTIALSGMAAFTFLNMKENNHQPSRPNSPFPLTPVKQLSREMELGGRDIHRAKSAQLQSGWLWEKKSG